MTVFLSIEFRQIEYSFFLLSVATQNLVGTVIELQALLEEPNPNDPMKSGIAAQYKANKERFIKTAQYWTYQYAGGIHKDATFDALIDNIYGSLGTNMSIHTILEEISQEWDAAEFILARTEQ